MNRVSDNIYDVIIVGAGPAGLSAAYSIAKKDLNVLVIEKSSGIGDVIRTSGATFIEDMKNHSIPAKYYNPNLIYKLYSPNHNAEFKTDLPEACILDVRGLYKFLARKAASAGAQILLKTKVVGTIRNKGKITGVKVKYSTGEKNESRIFSKIIIDASGFSAIIGRKIGLVPKWSKFGVGVEYEAHATGFDPEEADLMVGTPYSPAGYAWVFPVNDEIIRIGVGISRPQSNENPMYYLKNLVEKRLGPLKDVDKIVPIEFHYGIVPNEMHSLTVKENVMLVGDAAGQRNPLVLEGIRYALTFGSLAGEIAARAIKTQNISEKYLMKYESRWRKQVENNFRIGYLIQNEWLRYSDKEWDEEIKTLHGISGKDFIEFLKCNFSLRYILKMSISYPSLLKNNAFKKVLRLIKS